MGTAVFWTAVVLIGVLFILSEIVHYLFHLFHFVILCVIVICIWEAIMQFRQLMKERE